MGRSNPPGRGDPDGAGAASGDRWLCGWRVASDLPLPDLVPWRGDDRAPDVAVRLGPVPDALPEPVHAGPLLQIDADGTCRFAIAGVAAYLIEGGRSITVQTEIDPGAPDIRVFLLGSVLGFLCHQRGLLPLHAGCVALGGRAVAFAGPSGAGKSTLTAAFRRRGFPVLADDVTVVDASAPGGPRVLPSFPRIKLWREAIDGLGLSADGLDRVRTNLDKYSLPLEAGFHPEPLPLGAVYILEEVSDTRRAGIAPLAGIARVDALAGAVYRRTVALPGRQDALAAALMRIAARPAGRLSRTCDLTALDALVDVVVAEHARTGAGVGR